MTSESTRRFARHSVAVGALCVTTIALCMLAACSNSPSRGKITAALNKWIKAKSCFALQEKKAPTWPIRVQRAYGPLDPLLAAMQAAGYLQITSQPQGFGALIDVIKPTDQAKGWWDAQEGFCVGTKVVADVEEWTDYGKDSTVTQVKFTWHLKDVPSWAKRSEFKDMPGMTKPVDDAAILQKTNNGWKVGLGL
jgi:hypothetical protein